MIKRNYSCPKYISINDMKKILDYLENDTKLSSETKLKYECIFRLMYEAGLRIGEVLGLSLEDFELRKRKLDGLPVGIITIRNRLSDSRIQNAKTCMNIFDKKQYELGSYKTFGSGFQTITVSESLYNDIMDYFDMYCVKLQKNKKRPAIADTVTDEFKESNYYIFNNETVNTPLRKKTLEKYTRDMFEYLDIPIDTEKRFNNLFHRFRHGFIMNLLYEKNLPPSEVIKYSRHTSTRSLEPYNNPTDEELTKHLENIETDYEEFDWEGEDDE